MKKIYNIVAGLLTAVFFNNSVANAQVYLTGEQITMTGVTNGGVAVGSGYNTTHFRWTKSSGTQELGSVNVALLAGQTKVSGDGKYVTGTMTNPETSLNEMSLYNVENATWTHLGGLSSSSDDSKSSPWGMSTDGSTIVGLGWISASIGHAMIWTSENGTQDLGSTVTGRSSRANAINDDKSVIVGWQDNEVGTRQGAYWKNGEQFIIKNNDNVPVGEAGAVSSDGKTIVGLFGFYPYVFNETTGYTEITHPNSGPFFRGGATAISADGKKVIGYFRPWPGGPYFGEGFIWTPESGRQNLNDYVTGLGIDTQGLTLSLPMAISPDGNYIAGIGLNSDNKVYGFVVDLTNYLGVSPIKKSNISVYPNPVKDVLNFRGAKTVSGVEVYNMAGQKVKTIETLSNNQVELSTLSKGNYIVKANVDGKAETFKFIKE